MRVILGLALLLATPGAAPAPTPGAPRLVVEQPVLDLGRAPRGSTVEGTFVLRNAGVRPLRILSAKPG
jgi:hypothetical protein